MKNNRKTLIWTVVIILVIIAGILAVKRAKKREANLPPAKMYSIVVSTIKPALKQVRLTLPYLAETQNDKDVKLASKIAGRITSIKPSGTTVKKGEIIARIDDTSIRSNISSVRAQLKAQQTALENLQSTHERTLKLLEAKGASIEQSQMEESKIAGLVSKVESLKQKLNELNNMLTYAVITSPVNGRISKTMVNLGDMAMPGHPVAGISADNGFFLMVRVPDDLKITGVLLDGKEYDATPLNSTFHGLSEYKVYTDALNMTTGNRVTVDVIVYEGNAINLPFDAILNRNGKSYVLLVDGDKAALREVNIVQTGENGIVISNDEFAGQEIVVAKQDVLLKLSGGVSLKVKEG
jgi:multidrug efflux pump subunit AcrA (membrane-fusion protein)